MINFIESQIEIYGNLTFLEKTQICELFIHILLALIAIIGGALFLYRKKLESSFRKKENLHKYQIESTEKLYRSFYEIKNECRRLYSLSIFYSKPNLTQALTMRNSKSFSKKHTEFQIQYDMCKILIPSFEEDFKLLKIEIDSIIEKSIQIQINISSISTTIETCQNATANWKKEEGKKISLLNIEIRDNMKYIDDKFNNFSSSIDKLGKKISKEIIL